MLGIDYSFARPNPSEIKAAGFDFVCRYLASSDGKRIDAAEVASLHANGLAIALVFEDYADQSLKGYWQGVADGTQAKAQAEAIGQPADRPIYFAVDFDASEAQQTPIDDYLRGVASAIGAERVGVYGGFYVVRRCAQNGTAKWFWQTLAWSGGQQYEGNHLYQNGDSAFAGGADVNEAKQQDYGQWPKEGITMDDEDIFWAYLSNGHSEADANLPANHEYWLGKKPATLSQELYRGSEQFRSDAVHHDEDVKAAYEKGYNDGKADVPPAPPAPTPEPEPTPTPDPNPGQGFWAKLVDGILRLLHLKK